MQDQQALSVQPLLEEIRAQAAAADESRSVAMSVIDGLKGNEIMRFSASENLGGLARSTSDIGEELEAVAAACGSTAWVLWNHLATFHLFAGLLGPEQSPFLSEIIAKGEWVCFPAGASTGVRATPARQQFTLEGKAAFGSGARYADWAGVAFVIEDRAAPQFSMVKLDQPGVHIDPDWKAMSLRAPTTVGRRMGSRASGCQAARHESVTGSRHTLATRKV